MSNLDNTYREELMDIYKNPSNKGSMSSPTVEVVEVNPFCGDEICLQLKIENGKITDAKFDGPACAVSVVASSYLTDSLKGKSLAKAKEFTKQMLLDMIGINLTTSRVKCATLSLESLAKAIKKYEETGK